MPPQSEQFPRNPGGVAAGPGGPPTALEGLARRSRRWIRLRVAGIRRRVTGPIFGAAYRLQFRRSIVVVPDGARFVFPEIGLLPIEQLPTELADAARQIVDEADLVLRHEMRFVSDQSHDYGNPIAWKRDPVTGKVWPDHFHRDLELVDLSEPSDPIRVWELSRGHQLLALARASRFAPERAELYLGELARELDDWIEVNPVGFGVNWGNAMEAAIRATNWIWAVATAGPENLPPETLRRVTKSLQQHGRFIRRNLESAWLRRGNHYLAELMGLASIGAAIEGDPTLSRSARSAARKIGPAMNRQFHGDGGNFEGSGPYHGLAMEMLLLSILCLERQGLAPPRGFHSRMEAIIGFALAIRHPDGRASQYGDSDSGRILPAGFDRPPSHDPVIWLAAAALDLDRPLSGVPDPEVAWTLGLDAWSGIVSTSRSEAETGGAFPETGIYVLEGGGTKLIVECGSLGRDYAGTHAHGDALSFELSVGGSPLIVDPGTISYTGDPVTRNEMRSTASHSTPQVDGEELAPFRPDWIFRIDEVAPPFVTAFDDSNDFVTLECGHDSYRRLPDPVRVRRRFRLDRSSGSLEIHDSLEGTGFHSVSMPLPLLPGVRAEQIDPARVRIRLGELEAEVSVEGAEVSLTEGPHSDGYGLNEPAPRIRLAWEGRVPHQVSMSVVPGS